MTNNQIIAKAVFEAFEGNPAALELQYHTFETWKAAGFSVRKGEHAVLCVYLWKHKTKKASQAAGAEASDDSAEAVEAGSFVKVKSYLFSSAQVERSKK